MTPEGMLAPRTRRLAGGALLSAVALGGWVMLQDSRAQFTNFVMQGDPGPFALPALCLAVIGVTGISLMAVGARSPRSDHPPHGRNLIPLVFLASVLVMPALMRITGTAGAVALFTFPWVLVLGHGTARRRAGLAAIMAVAAGALIHLVFVRLLNLPLPT